MPHENPDDTPENDSEEQSSTAIDALLEAVSRKLDPTKYEGLTELSIYSIHEHGSARTITLPQAADGFDDTNAVKLYYFEGGRCPFIIVAPVQI